MSNVVVVIAPDVGRADELAEVDEGSGLELEEVTSIVAPTLPELLAAVLVDTIADVLEFGAIVDDDDDDIEMEAAKGGGALAVEGSTSAPFPQ